jgi:hypothetical protein
MVEKEPELLASLHIVRLKRRDDFVCRHLLGGGHHAWGEVETKVGTSLDLGLVIPPVPKLLEPFPLVLGGLRCLELGDLRPESLDVLREGTRSANLQVGAYLWLAILNLISTEFVDLPVVLAQ